MNLERRKRIVWRYFFRVGTLLALVGTLVFVLNELSLLANASSYDMLITLTCSEGLYGAGGGAALYVTEPTGEECSSWNDVTSIGGWMETTQTYERYHLASAMDGFYYIKVLAGAELVNDTSALTQVTVLLFEGTSKETVINYGPFTFFDAWMKVGCVKMPDGVKVEWGDLQTNNNGGFGGCFVATAAYGTKTASEVRILSRFRDECLVKSVVGKSLVRVYYKISPPVARIIGKNVLLRRLVRFQLKPLIIVVKLIMGDEQGQR